MSKQAKVTLRYVLLALVMVSVILFLTKSSILLAPLFEIPFGNLLVVAAALAASASPLTQTNRPSTLTTLSVMSCVMALAWFPIGIKLSGNLGLNFVDDGRDSYHFMLLTGVTIFSALACLILTWLSVLWRKKRA